MGEGVLGFHGTPFGLDLVLRSTDDGLNRTSLFGLKSFK